MDIYLAIIVISTGLLTFLCVVSLLLSLAAYRLKRFPAKRLAELELELADIKDILDGVRALLKKLNARGARLAGKASERAEEGEESVHHPDSWAQLPGETPEAWKRRMRQTNLRAGRKP